VNRWSIGAATTVAALGLALGPGPEQPAQRVVWHLAPVELEVAQRCSGPAMCWSASDAPGQTERVDVVQALVASCGDWELTWSPVTGEFSCESP
jgi:hypothetical protein